jgi:hypothetical protein
MSKRLRSGADRGDPPARPKEVTIPLRWVGYAALYFAGVAVTLVDFAPWETGLWRNAILAAFLFGWLVSIPIAAVVAVVWGVAVMVYERVRRRGQGGSRG